VVGHPSKYLCPIVRPQADVTARDVLGRPLSLAEPAVDEGPSIARRLVAAARRRWLPAAMCVLVVPAVTLAWASRQPDTYEATASLLFRAPEAQTASLRTTFFEEALDRNRRAATNLELVSLENIAARAARTLGGAATASTVMDNLKVSGEPQSDLISVSGRAESPRQAARIATAVADAYIAFRRDADRARIHEAQDLLRQRIASLSPEELASQRGRTLRRRAIELDRAQSVEAGDAEIVEPASTPTTPSNTSAKRLGALALLGGAALALLVVLALERADRRVRDPDEAVEVLGFRELAQLRGLAPSDALRAGSLSWFELMREAGDHLPHFVAVTTSRGEEPAPDLLWGLEEAARREGIETRTAEGSDTAGPATLAAERLAGLAGDGAVVLLMATPLLVLELTHLDPDGVFVIATARSGVTRYRSAQELRRSLAAVHRLVLGVVIVSDRRRWASLRVG
jgi:capsular polysaccharide biosynthesis protein